MESTNLSSCKELPILIWANPEFVSDLYYLTGLMTPDPYFALKTEKELIVAVNPLEYGRAVKESNASSVIDITTLGEDAKAYLDEGCSGEGANILVVLKQAGIYAVEVTRDFPMYLGQELQENGIEVQVYPSPALKERIIKSKDEVDFLRDAIRVTEKCHSRVETILRESEIQEGQLKWQGDWLTSERVQQEIEFVCVAHKFIDGNPIVAGGDQACDPHERGSGILRANELIIVDIFPRSKTHHYWGDITRTFLKGEASDEQKKLVETVFKAQQDAIQQVVEGAITGEIHAGVEAHFEKCGYKTEMVEGVWNGFFHGTGHGFGLDIHEQPRIGKAQTTELKAGMIVTVEPGLYYPGLGGCRIEDDILVTENGCEVLSDFHYDWIIE